MNASGQAGAGPAAKPGAGARVAIDLGAESCRVSLLLWRDGVPQIHLVHRIPNGPVHVDGSLRWPFDRILTGLEEGLRKAAEAAPEGIASIAVDGWAVDYVRLSADGLPIANPFCYRDERSIASKEAADRIAGDEWMFRHSGAQPLRINTVYQLLADHGAGIDPRAPWVNLPEYVLYRLGGRRVAEYTNATHTALVDIDTGDWSRDLLKKLGLNKDAFPPIVPPGTVVGRLSGPLAGLPAFRNTQLIVPACHDTASAIAGIATSLDNAAYICSGTWSLVGTVVSAPIATAEAMAAGYTNQGAAGGGFCFHTNVNGMWILKQCLDTWRNDGRSWDFGPLIAEAAKCNDFPGIVPVDGPTLLLDGDMPARLNEQLTLNGCRAIEDCAGNEPMFARVIFESLTSRYASALRSLEVLTGNAIRRIHILGGGSLNKLLTRLTSEKTDLPVEVGNVESSTVGNFAVQCAAGESRGGKLHIDEIRTWAQRLSENSESGPTRTDPSLARSTTA
jgi:rhamnulokinase